MTDQKLFSLNGQLLPLDKAVAPVNNIEFSYGFGVYETVRVSGGVIYFAHEHIDRLLTSAKIIGLEHSFSAGRIEEYMNDLLEASNLKTSNLKMLLIGAPAKEAVQLYIMALNPLFPPRKLYTQGATCVTYKNERFLPHAKTLNMLPSYLAYREARAKGAYDALLVNRSGCVTEGTRTNLLCIKDNTIVSPPEDEILLGVMRKVVLKVALSNGFKSEERDIPLGEISQFDNVCLTSTSTKLMPVRSIDDTELNPVSDNTRELMKKVNQFLSDCKGTLD